MSCTEGEGGDKDIHWSAKKWHAICWSIIKYLLYIKRERGTESICVWELKTKLEIFIQIYINPKLKLW